LHLDCAIRGQIDTPNATENLDGIYRIYWIEECHTFLHAFRLVNLVNLARSCTVHHIG
jgi:hypothetical protein